MLLTHDPGDCPHVMIPGMAHFAGTGPAGQCCGDCAYGHYVESARRREKWWCGKVALLPGGSKACNRIEPHYAACKYFQARRTAPGRKEP